MWTSDRWFRLSASRRAVSKRSSFLVEGCIMSVLVVVFKDEPESSAAVQVVVDGMMSEDVVVVLAVARNARFVALRLSTASLRTLGG